MLNEAISSLVALQYLIGLSGAGVLGSMAFDIYKKNKKNNKLATATLGDLKQFKDMEGTDGLKISPNLQLSEKYSNEGTIVFGSTGCGKTTKIMLPNLLSNDLKGSLVVTDPKSELYELSSYYQENTCKRNVKVFNPLNSKKSLFYNPLEVCKDTTEVEQLASSLILNGIQALELETGKKSGGADLTWVMMAEPLLTAALLYHKDLPYPYNNINSTLKFLIEHKDEDIEYIFSQSKNKKVIDNFNIYKMVGDAEKTKGGIKITLATNLKLFLNEDIAKVTSKTDFNADEFRKNDSILYICYNEHQANYLSPLLSVFYGQLMNHFIESKYKKHITFLIDEAGNIGRIPRLNINVSTVRSRDISLMLIFHDINQMNTLYGRDGANTILNNLKTKILLPGSSDLNTLNYFVSLCDKSEIIVSNNNNSNERTTISNNKAIRNLFTIDELRTLEKHEYIAIIHNKKVIKNCQEFYFENIEYLNRIKKNKLELQGINNEDIKIINKPYNYPKIKEKTKETNKVNELLSEIWSKEYEE